ncbi:MAG: GldG family protein, partial [Chitinophagales bacterium]|nr:GldG family protein [Chitinophagales bacterium]
MLTKSAITFKILAAIVAVLAINVLSSFLFARLDFTGDKRYTLSQATKDILADLDSSVTVTAYFSDNLPAQIQYVRNEFEDLLVEYSNRSGGKIDYHFEDPSGSPEKEQAAMQQGVRPLVVQARERDQFKEQRAYMGAVLQHNG